MRSVLRRLPTFKAPLRLRVRGLVALATALTATVSSGCGGEAKGPPISVEIARSSPVAGMQDDRVAYADQDPSERVGRMADSGAAVIRVDLFWYEVAPTRPVNAADPADPAYRWDAYDRVVQAAEENDVEVLFAVYGTPAWAADPDVVLPEGIGATAARPNDAVDFGAFATAAAARFSPRGVRKWEAWNEPNTRFFLSPQYERQGARWVATSPKTYSDLLKRFSEGIKSIDPGATVAGGVTAPTGDPCGVSCAVSSQPERPGRVKPDAFFAALDGEGLRPPMDIVSHHPYPASKPREATLPNRNYVDLYNLQVLTAAIDRTYLRGSKLWLTEYGFGTRAVTQYPLHFTPQEQAIYIVDAFERIRTNSRVEMLVYYLLQDHSEWASGLLDVDGSAKAGLAAHALPFGVVSGAPPSEGMRLAGQVRATPGRTQVRIEWRSGDAWRRLVVATTTADGSFAVRIPPGVPVTLRAVWTGMARSGLEVTWTSPEVSLPAPAGK